MQVERVHRGAVFDVYKLVDHEGSWAFKVCAEAPRTEADKTRFVRSATLGGVSTLWNLWGGIGASAPSSDREIETAQLRAFLAEEAARIRSSRDMWNHEVRGLAEYDLPGRGPTFGLCTRWFDGTPLAALPRAEQRALFPQMLPALWDALGTTLHGDLHPDNLIVASDHFALIDPGAMHATSRGRSGPSSGATSLVFITHGESYPLLPPFSPSLAPGARLAAHWAALLESLQVSHHYPPVPAASNTWMQTFDGLPNLVPPPPGGRPASADLLAAGVLYYQILTSRPPYPEVVEHGPAWAALHFVDDNVTGGERGAAWIASPPRSPRAIEPSVSPAEEQLAMALLELAIDSREQLVELIREVLRQAAGT